MTLLRTAPDVTALEPRPKLILAGIRVPTRGWESALARSFAQVLSTPPRGAHVFRRVLAHAAQFGHQMAVLGQTNAADVNTTSYTVRFPLATALILLRRSPATPLGRTLAWLLLEIHLEGTNPDLVGSLSTRVRGLSETRSNNSLLLTIAECDGLEHLVRKLEALDYSAEGFGQITGNKLFDAMWRDSLAGICQRLIQRTVETDDDDDDGVISLPLNSRDVTPSDPLETDLSSHEPDESPYFSVEGPSGASSASAVFAKRVIGWVGELHRRSSPELFRDPEYVVPAALIQREWIGVIETARKAIDESDTSLTEKCLLHLLAIETGLTDREAISAAFGRTTHGGVVALDLRARALRRPELRPPNAFTPKSAFSQWLPTGGDILVPLSRPTLQVAANVLRQRYRQRLATAAFVLVNATEDSYPVRQAMHETRTSTGLSVKAYRLRLAAGIAGKLGLDAAQISFGDSFGLSTAPTYYASFSSEQLAIAFADWNPEIPELDPRCLAACTHSVGSRVRPSEPPFAEAWDTVGVSSEPARGRPSLKDPVARWRKRRDGLATHLMLAVGHRPNQTLAEIRLSDFLPKAALVRISDKRTDPAHMTRLACTGHKFVGALEEFVRELERIAREPALGSARKLALKILAGNAYVFDTPGEGDSSENLNVAKLMTGMPSRWAARRNVHRHSLGQALIHAGVDPELRYFQMGWLVTDVHATSDAAPQTALELGQELAGPIDNWLEQIGWYGGHLPKHEVVIHRQHELRNWSQDLADHHAQFEGEIKRLKQGLRERSREVRPMVLEQLRNQIEKNLPSFELGAGGGPPVLLRRRAMESEARPLIDSGVVSAILECFETPLHAHVARVELGRILGRAMKAGYCRAHLPRVQSLSFARVPSPFIPELGLAVTHAELLRNQIAMIAGKVEPAVDGDLAVRLARLSVWAIAAYTPYRRIDIATKLGAAAVQARNSEQCDWLFRIPMDAGHGVITGVPAVLLARTLNMDGGREALEALGAGSESHLGKLLLELLPAQTAGLSAENALRRMESTLLVAGEVEEPGPARLVMRGVIRSGTVSAVRAASVFDGKTVRNEILDLEMEADDDEEMIALHGRHNPPHRPVRRIIDLMQMFNPDYSGEIGRATAKPPKRRKPQLLPLVRKRIETMGGVPTFSLMVLEYIHHLLDEGGPRSSGGMAVSTIYKIYHQISPALAALDDDRDLTSITSEDFTGILMVAIERSKRRDKIEVLRALREFFRFSRRGYSLAPPTWELLAAAAGDSVRASDPAVVSGVEIGRILVELADNARLENDASLDPAERRLREVQFAAALIAVASGARPGSIHGLTLADIHIFRSRSFIHLQSKGRFASIKTSTSAGFIPLEGGHWESYAPWFAEWLDRVYFQLKDAPPDHVPIFQIPGQPLGARYPMKAVFGRIGELVRWSTGQSAGRTYWLRKFRVGRRHSRVVGMNGARARDVVRTMRVSGHMGILTPVASYLGDPITYMPPRTVGQELADVRHAAAISGLSATAVEQRWRRKRNRGVLTSRGRIGSLLRLPPPGWPSDPPSSPPPYKPFLNRFTWLAVGRVMERLVEGGDVEDIAKTTSTAITRVEEIRERVSEFGVRTGRYIGPEASQLHPSRSTQVARALIGFLEAEDARLMDIAADWVSLARTTSGDGCPLLEARAVGSFHSVLHDMHLQAKIQPRGELPPIFHVVSTAGHEVYGGWPALRWALAVVWVAGKTSPSA